MREIIGGVIPLVFLATTRARLHADAFRAKSSRAGGDWMTRQSGLMRAAPFAAVVLLSSSAFGCSRAAAKRQCEELQGKAVQFAEGPEMNGARSVEDVRSAFDKQSRLFDEAERACRDAKDADRLAGIDRGRQALTALRAKTEGDARANVESAALKQLDGAREDVTKAKAAMKKSDYKMAAPLLLGAMVKVAAAEQTRATCIGIVDAGACGDGGALSPAVEQAIISSSAQSWLVHGNEGGILRGPKSKDSAALVEEVHALWAQHAAQLNAALPRPAGQPQAARADDDVEAKVRGNQHDAELLVPTYVRGQLVDPDSYEYVEGFGSGTPKGPFWVVTWTWKANNAFGAKVQTTKTFCVSAGSTEAVIPCTR